MEGPQKLVCDLLVVVVISSLKIPKAFLIKNKKNFVYTFVLILSTDLPAQIFRCRNAIISVIKVHVIDLKLDTEPSLNVLQNFWFISTT